MSTPFVGQIRLVAFTFAPTGHAFCDGRLLPIDQNTALFSLIGTTYGGDGQVTFALPDLRGRIPVHQGFSPNGVSFVMGQIAGAETVTLNTSQLPAHTHAAAASDGTVGTPQNSPTNAFWNKWTGSGYSTSAANNVMNPVTVGNAGGNQPHENMPPFLVINYVIALFGIFPSRN